VQDIPTHDAAALAHSISEPKAAHAHEVTIVPGSCLARLIVPSGASATPVEVNSRHHQSVKDVAPGFVVSATAPDGVIEAIERPDRDFCVGVQWHPENFWATGEFGGLFQGFIAAARRHGVRS
jgi:putative glutamine amidotransferase